MKTQYHKQARKWLQMAESFYNDGDIKTAKILYDMAQMSLQRHRIAMCFRKGGYNV